uniref:Uncharacterized protein n=1 Tax=Zonotrichia albicollis TaxID=44394 RepID=A0A8D2MZS8_ZONAL
MTCWETPGNGQHQNSQLQEGRPGLRRSCCVYAREFVREKKYKTEAEAFGWSFVFEDFVSEELKKKVTQKLEVNLKLQHFLTNTPCCGTVSPVHL